MNNVEQEVDYVVWLQKQFSILLLKIQLKTVELHFQLHSSLLSQNNQIHFQINWADFMGFLFSFSFFSSL